MSAMFDAIDWSDPMPAPRQDEISSVEETVGAQIPADFVKFCQQYHGGYPDPDEIEVEGFGRTMVDQILPFVDDPAERIRSIATVFEAVDGLTPGLIPFASEPGGNYFCFDSRSGRQKIVFGFHEQF